MQLESMTAAKITIMRVFNLKSNGWLSPSEQSDCRNAYV